MQEASKVSNSIYYQALVELGGCATPKGIAEHLLKPSEARRPGPWGKCYSPRNASAGLAALLKRGMIQRVGVGVYATLDWQGSLPWDSTGGCGREEENII